MYNIEELRNKVIQGDSLEVLKNFPDNSVDTVITDPPYGLSNINGKTIKDVLKHWLSDDESYIPPTKGFMNKKWDAFVPPPALWREVYRVVKPGATLLVFAGTRTQDLMTLSLRLAGFEIKDTLMWLKGSGFPKSQDISKMIDKKFGAERKVIRKEQNFGVTKLSEGKNGYGDYKGEWEITEPATTEAKQWNGYKTHSLKPAYEPIIMAMKPNDGSYVDNALKWNVSGLNIKDSRIGVDEHIVKGGGGGKGTGRGKKEEVNIKVAGRYPSNVLLDEVSAEMLDRQAPLTGQIAPTTGKEPSASKRNMIYGDYSMVEGKASKPIDKLAGASRFFYVAKATQQEKNAGCENFDVPEYRWNSGGKMKQIKGQKGNFHPTVKPLKLMTYLVKLTMMPNSKQVYMDPFLGSGTTAVAVKSLMRTFIGIEQDPRYCDIARRRIEALGDFLFSEF